MGGAEGVGSDSAAGKAAGADGDQLEHETTAATTEKRLPLIGGKKGQQPQAGELGAALSAGKNKLPGKIKIQFDKMEYGEDKDGGAPPGSRIAINVPLTEVMSPEGLLTGK
jgi:hypothetical protein